MFELADKNTVKRLLKKEITLEDIYDILKVSKHEHSSIDNCFKNAENSNFDTVFVDGNLEIIGGADLSDNNIANLVVTGDLICDSLFEFDSDPAAFVFVGGDVRVQSLAVNGTFEVLGDLTADTAIFGHGDKSIIHGDINANFTVSSPKLLTVLGGRYITNAYTDSPPKGEEEIYCTHRELYLLLHEDMLVEPISKEEFDDIDKENYNSYPYFSDINTYDIVCALRFGFSIFRE